MLINIGAKVLFYARSVKRPGGSIKPLENRPQQQQEKQKQNATDEFIDVGSAEREKKLKQEADFEEFMKALNRASPQKPKLTQEQKDAKRELQLQSLSIPESIKQKYFEQVKPHEVSHSQDALSNPNNHEDQSEQGQGQPGAMNLKHEFLKLKQSMIMEQITKNSKEKEAEVQIPEKFRPEFDKRKAEQNELREFINEKIRYEKLREIASTQQKKGEKFLKSSLVSRENLKLEEPTADEIWQSQYPKELMEQAKQYKNRELDYFKRLVEGQSRPQEDYERESEWIKAKKPHQKFPQFDKANNIRYDQPSGLIGHEPREVEQEEMTGLTRYKDDEYYRERGIKDFEELEKKADNSYDRELMEEGLRDLTKGNRLSEVFEDDFLGSDESRIEKREKYEKSTFGKYQTKLRNVSQKMVEMGIEHDFEDLAVMNKEELFADKKNREENLRYQQYLLKKERIKKMKQQSKKMHKEKLRDDLNFDNERNHQKAEGFDPHDFDGSLEKLEQIKKDQESLIVSNQDRKSKIHYKKTLSMMTHYINAFFYENLDNYENPLSRKIDVISIISNKKNTVLNIFWDFKPSYQKIMLENEFSQEDRQGEIETIQKKLDRQASYISGKMTQLLGLRYGPDIRFYFDKKVDQTEEVARQMRIYRKQIIDMAIEEYKEKGMIKNQKDYELYREKLQVLADDKMNSQENRKYLLSDKYKQKQKIEKIQKKRESLKEQKRKKKSQHKNDSEQKDQRPAKGTLRQEDQKILEEVLAGKAKIRKGHIFEQDQSEKSEVRSAVRPLRQKKGPNSQQLKNSEKGKRQRRKASSHKLWKQIDAL